MKDKIKSFFVRKPSVSTGSYYEADDLGEQDEHSEYSELPIEKEVKLLRKENEQLKKEFQNQAINKFKNRRSIRKFSTQKIDFKIIYNIIESGLNAPCAGNIQNTKIILIEKPDQKLECAKAALQQYWITDAPYLLIIVRDDGELFTLYPEHGQRFSVQNSAALIENILMAAHSYDLGACWVDACDNGMLKETLKIPTGKHIDAIIPIGYPLESPKVEKCPTAGMVFFEKWGEKKR